MRFCFCEDATALQRRDHIENKVIRRQLEMGRNVYGNAIAS
jgi:hypothetical protein